MSWPTYTRLFTTVDAAAPIFCQKSAGIAPVGPLYTPAHGRTFTTSIGRFVRTAYDVMST